MFLCNSGVTVLFVCLFLKGVHPFGSLNSEPLAGPSIFKDFIETYSDLQFMQNSGNHGLCTVLGIPLRNLFFLLILLYIWYSFFLGAFPFTHEPQSGFS